MNICNTIRTELEDAGTVYSMLMDQGGAHNLDYAGYAGQHITLEKLQEMLGNPELSIDQLESLMRKVIRKHSITHPEQKWSNVMARFITRHANGNIEA